MSTFTPLADVSTQLAQVVKNNIVLLKASGFNGPRSPEVTCNCVIKPELVNVVTPSEAPSLTAGDLALVSPVQSTSPQVIQSQFVKGMTSIPEKLDLHPIDVGNTPFILPAGVTPESILDAQKLSASEMTGRIEDGSAKVVPALLTTRDSAMTTPIVPPLSTNNSSSTTTVPIEVKLTTSTSTSSSVADATSTSGVINTAIETPLIENFTTDVVQSNIYWLAIVLVLMFAYFLYKRSSY